VTSLQAVRNFSGYTSLEKESSMAVRHRIMGRHGMMKMTLTPLKAIRRKCLECSNFSHHQVRNCPIETCPLYPFRFGKNPPKN